jgi:hypothetical protein
MTNPKIKVERYRVGAWKWTCGETGCGGGKGFSEMSHALAVGLTHREMHQLLNDISTGLHFV